MKKYIQILTALLLLIACNTNTPSAISVKNKIYKHPTAVQYLKFKTDSVLYYGDFGNETLNNHTFAYSQKDEVVTVFTPTPEHLLAYEGFVLRGDTIYELFADTSDPNYQDHQPADPATFSLVGKRYVYESTANRSPAPDKYYAEVLDFFSGDQLCYYETPNRDLSEYVLWDRLNLTYRFNFPSLYTFSTPTDSVAYTMIDTATIVRVGIGITYTLRQ